MRCSQHTSAGAIHLTFALMPGMPIMSRYLSVGRCVATL